jgi:hypothetical protein
MLNDDADHDWRHDENVVTCCSPKFITVMADIFHETLEIDCTPTLAVVEGGFVCRNWDGFRVAYISGFVMYCSMQSFYTSVFTDLCSQLKIKSVLVRVVADEWGGDVLGNRKSKDIYLQRDWINIVIYVFGKVCLSNWGVICQSQYLLGAPGVMTLTCKVSEMVYVILVWRSVFAVRMHLQACTIWVEIKAWSPC